MSEVVWLDRDRPDDELLLFARLRTLSQGLTTEGRAMRQRLDLDEFEALADNLVIVRAAPRFGDFRFEFYGSAFSEASPGGDLTGLNFGELLGSPYYRSCLSGFWHVHRLGLAHVTRNHQVTDGRSKYFTRLLIPIFASNRTDIILCAARLHDQPAIVLPAREEPETLLVASA